MNAGCRGNAFLSACGQEFLDLSRMLRILGLVSHQRAPEERPEHSQGWAPFANPRKQIPLTPPPRQGWADLKNLFANFTAGLHCSTGGAPSQKDISGRIPWVLGQVRYRLWRALPVV